jgi:hypothetical protein
MNPFMCLRPLAIVILPTMAALTLPAPARGQPRPGAGLENGPPKSYLCCRVNAPPAIDGRLDENAWKSAPWSDDFVDIQGSLKPLPRYRTRMKMLWDDSYLYIGADLEEPHVRAALTKHDTVIFYDNDFEVFIDPNGDNHEYYELEMNALNTTWDLFLNIPYKDGGTPDDGWEISGLITAVYVNGTLNDPSDLDRGWSVELALPWRALQRNAYRPCPPREGDAWRINFSRVEWDTDIVDGRYRTVPGRPENNWVWSPQWVIDMHWPELWGYLQFTNDTAGQRLPATDSTLAARTVLMKVYYAQRRFRETHGRWGSTLEEIGYAGDTPPGAAKRPSLRLTPEGYEAEFGGMSIRHDSLLKPVLGSPSGLPRHDKPDSTHHPRR